MRVWFWLTARSGCFMQRAWRLALLCGVLLALAVPSSEAFVWAGHSANAGSWLDVSWVSCTSAGNCTVVGDYVDSAGDVQGLLFTETSGAWAAGVEASLPANAGTDPRVGLSSVFCASAGNCTAVGDYVDSSGDLQGLLLTETAGVWATGVEANPPANADTEPFPVGRYLPGVSLYSVSCASAGNCSAIGEYTDSAGHEQGLVLTETSGVWATGVEAILPANAGPDASLQGLTGRLNSVACASAGNCSAVGVYPDTAGFLHGLLLTETSGVWATGVEASPPANAGTDPSVGLGSVSCASAGNCTAVGGYVDSAGREQGLVVTETSGAWAAGVEASPPANAGTDPRVGLGSVSCASAGSCTAVGGYYDSSGYPQVLLLTGSSGAWATGVEASLPANAATNPSAWVVLGGLSCASAGNCTAVGDYVDSAGLQQGLLLTETSGASATGIEASPPANAATVPRVYLSSVSCASAGTCTAVGGYNDSSGDLRGLLLTETSGVWATGVEATPPTSAGGTGVEASPPTSAGTNPGVELSRLRASPKAFVLGGRRVNGRCVKQTTRNRAHRRCGRAVKLTISYRLNRSGSVMFTLKRVVHGRRINGRCVKPTNNNPKRRRCSRLINVPGKVTISGAPGANSFTFRGRIAGGRLGPGTYRLTATPQANGQAGSSQTIAFKIAA